jgi:hypothetical protein
MVAHFDIPMGEGAVLVELALALFPVLANHSFVIVDDHWVEV